MARNPGNGRSSTVVRGLEALALLVFTGFVVLASSLLARAQERWPATAMEVPEPIRAYYFNPDGSCVQLSIGIVGQHMDVEVAKKLPFNSEFGPGIRGGSGPGRVESYARARGMRIYNVTGSQTFEWMKLAAKTGRFAAIGAGGRHFQTLWGYDPATETWLVCNNQSPRRIDRYTDAQFRRLHLASGQWIVILDYPATAPIPQLVKWW